MFIYQPKSLLAFWVDMALSKVLDQKAYVNSFVYACSVSKASAAGKHRLA
jgi:hypothetical protein